MPSVVGIGTAVPEKSFSKEEILEAGKEWLKDQPEKLELFRKFVLSSKTENRHFVVPANDLLKIGGLKERSQLFDEFAPALGAEALQNALKSGGVNSSEVKTQIFTSCSCPSIPAIDALIIERLKLNSKINRIPIFQHGCAGGVFALRLASDLCKVQGLTVVTSVELCSLVFQSNNPSGAQLVGAAIFADGAASAIISPEEKGLVIRGSESYLIPNSRHLMGYDILDDGFHLKLDRNLPQALVAVAPEQISSFLAQHGLRPKDIAHWLFHPGGIKILDFLEAKLELRPEQAIWARETLMTVGNLSSASVLFVLNNFLSSKVYRRGDKIVMLGIGPGLTLELILFEWVE